MTDTDLTPEQVAFNAHTNFRKLIPQFESFARNVLGRTVSIYASTNSSTDGEKIFIKPPYELGFNYEHNRNLCDRLDYAGFQRCPACGVRENLIFQVYHEISHLVYGTFEGLYDQAAPILREHGVPGVRRLSKATRDWSIYHTAFTTSPYLGIILNSVEDVRVDSKMFFVKPGLRRMMQVNIQSIMDKGIKDLDGRVTFWKDLPLDVQAIMFFYMTGRKQGFRQDVFAPEVIALESDEKLLDLLSGMERLASVAESFDRAIRLWQHGKSLGFFLEEGTDEPPTEQQEPEQQESEDKGDGSPGLQPSGSQEPDEEESSSASSDEDGAESETTPDLEDDGESDSGGSSESGDSETGEPGDNDSGSDQESDESGDEDAESDGDSEPGDSAGSDPGDADGDSEPDEGMSGESGDPGEDSSESGDGVGDEESDEGESSGSGTADNDSTSPGDERDSESAVDGDPSSQPGEGNESDDEYDDSESDPLGEDHGDTGDQTGDGDGGLDASDNLVRDGLGGDGRPTDSGDPARDTQPHTAPAMGTDDDTSAGETQPETAQAEAPREATPEELWKAYRERHGSTDQVKDALEQIIGHAEVNHAEPTYLQSDEDRAMATAAKQSVDFDEASDGLVGVVKVHTPSDSWAGVFRDYQFHEEQVIHARAGKYELSGADLGMAASKMRKVFSENKRNRYTKNTKRGKVNSAVLGRRAPTGDGRVFQRKEVNEERDYAVLLIGDISGSTAMADRLEQEKASLMAQADLLWKIGVKFQVLCHSGYDISALHGRSQYSFYGHKGPESLANVEEWGTGGEVLVIATVKDWNEPWGEIQRDRLKNIPSTGYNLDGHAFEYCRKQLQARPETDRVLMYYSDGQMPAKNFNEELYVLQRELQLMEKLRIAVAAVGIQDNGPAKHGIPMIQFNEKSDIHKVVDHVATQLGAV